MADLAPVAYLDSSALIKLVVPEPESEALRTVLADWNRRASSALARTEVVRAAARIGGAADEPAERVVRSVSLIAVSEEILERAAELEPRTLRTLDAIHLASALALGDALGAVFTYDIRMGQAATLAGLDVLAPA